MAVDRQSITLAPDEAAQTQAQSTAPPRSELAILNLKTRADAVADPRLLLALGHVSTATVATASAGPGGSQGLVHAHGHRARAGSIAISDATRPP